jgi:hypothetical protein
MSKQDIVAYQFDKNQSRREAAKNGKLGGVRSGQSKKLKKHMKEYVNDIVNAEIPPHLKKALIERNYDKEFIDKMPAIKAMIHSIIEKVITTGDAVAFDKITKIIKEYEDAKDNDKTIPIISYDSKKEKEVKNELEKEL